MLWFTGSADFTQSPMKYLFGPIVSRRLGVSLGVDILPPKTCNLNCIYCEVGSTTSLTNTIAEYSPTEEIIRELDEYLASRPAIDSITFSGSGEPTIHSGIGKIIRHLVKNYPAYKVSVLTNGTLLWKKEIREALSPAHLVLPSLDAASEKAFRKINAPEKSLDINKIIDGLEIFCREFSGEVWLEIFISPGINDTDEEIQLLISAVKKIKPHKVQLNSLDRPGTIKGLIKEPLEKMEYIRKTMTQAGIEHVEITGHYDKTSAEHAIPFTAENLKDIIERRPQTLEDILAAFDINRNDLEKQLQLFIDRGIIHTEDQDRGRFYVLNKK